MTISTSAAAIVRTASAQVGLNPSTAIPLRQHATSIWLLADLDVVARVGQAVDRAALAVDLTRWLSERGFPASEPIHVDQPVVIDNAAVTFWRYYPQGERPIPSAGALGALLRRLHQLPPPPAPLGRYRPLAGLGRALEIESPIDSADRAWLVQRRQTLLTAYGNIDSALGAGLIHGDAYPGNTLWDGPLVRLADWDEAASGPRELDLINTHQGARFGRSAAERQAFTEAYGWDVTAWPGYPILREIRELHTLGAFIKRAARGDDAATAELHHRVASLRSDDTTSLWGAG